MYRNIFSKIFSSVFYVAFLSLLLMSTTFPLFEKVAAQVATTNSKIPVEVLIRNMNCIQTGANMGAGTTYKCPPDGKIYTCIQGKCSEGTNAQVQQQQRDEKIKEDNDPSGCNPLWGFSIADCIVWVADWTLYYFILAINNFLLRPILRVASFAFDASVYYTIVTFKTNFSELQTFGVGNTLFGPSNNGLVYYLWGLIRDFLNIIIFLIIIYSAVLSMFEGFENTRKRFISLLVFSIVVNFSLLFVKISIDISNILALQAYTLVVKPTGTSSFSQFTTVNSSPRSFAEFIMNSISMDMLQTDVRTSSDVKAAIAKQSNTFMAEVGKMIVIVALIYLLFYMASLLLMRAIYFLFSMILSPLLALDIFFEKFGKNNSQIQDVATTIRGVTDRIRGDFFDSLIKGPMLIFFVFLIGVLAESIFSQGVLKDLTQGIGDTNSIKSAIPKSFINAIFTLFKFATFFAMCIVLFKKMNAINFGGRLTGGNLQGFGKGLTNLVLGRGLGAAAWAGRNTIGRGIKASGLSSRFGTMGENALRSLENKNLGLIGRGIARTKLSFADQGLRLTKGIQGGSFDARAPLGKGALGNLIKNAGGVDIAGGALGKAGTEGFEDIEKRNAKDRETANEERVKRFGGAVDGEINEEKLGKENTEFAGIKMTLKTMEELAKSNVDQLKQQAASSGGKVTVNGQSFTTSQLDSIFDKKRDVDVNKAYQIERASAEEKMREKGKKEFAKSMQKAAAAGNLGKTFDRVNPSGRSAAATVQENAQAEVYKSQREKDRDDIDKERKSGARKYLITQLSKDIDNVISKLDTAALVNPGDAEIIKQRDELKDYKSQVDANKENLSFFEGNSSLIERIVRTKEAAAESIKSTFSTERSRLESEERTLQTRVSDSKRGVSRREYDSWTSELAAMQNPSRREGRSPEFLARKRRLEADIQSANKNGYAQTETTIKSLEEELRDKQKALKDITSNFNSAREIETTSEKTRRAFENNFAVQVAKAPDTPKPAGDGKK